MLIGSRLKKLRLDHKMSQQELGNLLGVTKVSISGYENNTRVPSLDTFCQIIDVFNTNADYLLGREVRVLNEENKNYIGSISSADIKIIRELRCHPNLYANIVDDTRRMINYINKKVRNER